MRQRASVVSTTTRSKQGDGRTVGRAVAAVAAAGLLAATAACADEPHDVTCGVYLRMPGDGQHAVAESFLDDHPIGRTVFGRDDAGQVDAAVMALHGYCQQHEDENIKDLEPDLVPGF